MTTDISSRRSTVGVVVDTSAAVAIIFNGPGAASLLAQLAGSAPRLMTSANFVELGIVTGARLGGSSSDVVRRFVSDGEIEIEPVDASLAERAIIGWHRFGKGRHSAGLNFGDCFSYALSEMTGLPILCTGDDFAATDLAVLRPTS